VLIVQHAESQTAGLRDPAPEKVCKRPLTAALRA
jgi:hypothetical protein